MTALTLNLLREGPQLQAIASEWETLAASLEPRTPFTTPLWNLLWWTHFRQRRSLVRDELCACTVRDAQGRLLAVAPMMLTQRPGIGPLRSCQLHFFGADPNITELRGLVCAPEDEARVVPALARHLQSSAACDWHWLQWYGLRSTAAVELQTGPHGAVLVRSEEVPDYLLALPDSWERFREGLPRNIKESLRKCYNSLKRDGLVFEFRVVEEPAAAGPALERFYELHAARAAAGGVRHQNVFATPQARRFLGDYARQMAERGQLRVFQIAIGGAIVATRIGFAFDRTLYLYYSGYDPVWARYSVMTTTLAESIKWAIAGGYTTVNLSTGRDISKTRWGATELSFHNALLKRPTWRARLAYAAYTAFQTGRNPNRLLAGLTAYLRRG